MQGSMCVHQQLVGTGSDVLDWQALRVGARPPGQRIDVRLVEPKVEDRVFLVSGVGVPSSLVSLLRNKRQGVHKRDAHRCKTFGGCR